MYNFKRLPLCNVLNARISVSELVDVSISYSDSLTMWGVGSIGSYECAIILKDCGKEDLVHFSDIKTNIFTDCDDSKIQELIERAKSINYYACIYVFTTTEGEISPSWHLRFLCNQGYDFEKKLEYAKHIYKDLYRVEYR